jgi:hypothetical protein
MLHWLSAPLLFAGPMRASQIISPLLTAQRELYSSALLRLRDQQPLRLSMVHDPASLKQLQLQVFDRQHSRHLKAPLPAAGMFKPTPPPPQNHRHPVAQLPSPASVPVLSSSRIAGQASHAH